MNTEVQEKIVSPPLARREKRPPAFLPELARVLQAKPFRPHPMFTSGHAQTFGAYYWPRRFRLREHLKDEARIFEVERDVRLLAHCRWQKSRHLYPTLLLVHGLEGANTSVYMLATAAKAFRAGFNVVRLNLRTCGKTEHLTPTFYHSGLTDDLRFVLRELAERDNLSRIFMAGFSLGGNMSLLLAGEDADDVPRELAGICAISPTIELGPCAQAVERRANWLYKQSFMRSMRQRVRRKSKFFPERYNVRQLRGVRTIREFDERYTVVDGGYKSVEDYYERASSLHCIPDIRTPALIIHAQDDPLVPFEPFRHPSIKENPYLIFLAPEHGGHVGFVGADANGEDRFWMENRVVEFCRLVNDSLSGD
jgi:predicted alpha/beta-fold hydrolase